MQRVLVTVAALVATAVVGGAATADVAVLGVARLCAGERGQPRRSVRVRFTVAPPADFSVTVTL